MREIGQRNWITKEKNWGKNERIILVQRKWRDEGQIGLLCHWVCKEEKAVCRDHVYLAWNLHYREGILCKGTAN